MCEQMRFLNCFIQIAWGLVENFNNQSLTSTSQSFDSKLTSVLECCQICRLEILQQMINELLTVQVGWNQWEESVESIRSGQWEEEKRIRIAIWSVTSSSVLPVTAMWPAKLSKRTMEWWFARNKRCAKMKNEIFQFLNSFRVVAGIRLLFECFEPEKIFWFKIRLNFVFIRFLLLFAGRLVKRLDTVY